jgi:hypothetical protein
MTTQRQRQMKTLDDNPEPVERLHLAEPEPKFLIFKAGSEHANSYKKLQKSLFSYYKFEVKFKIKIS